MRASTGVLFALIAITGVELLRAGANPTDDAVVRGEYLVNSAGKCTDCHGPKLQGMQLDFMRPGLPIVYKSAKIAGLTQLSSDAATTFLETGKLPNGKSARPPMPQYRFNHDDAAAIVAYLKSLK